MSPTRRALLGLAALPALPAAAARTGVPPPGQPPGQQPDPAAEWQAFRARFVTAEGRVVDSFNQGISHSEGQGWALLAAQRLGDRAGFELILSWTRRHLSRPGDALFAWRWRPQLGAVDDSNNATDGDLMIAWALLEAGGRWRDPVLEGLGAATARDILRLLVRKVGEEVVLLPGARGFEARDHVVLNPSYYAFPAFRVLARAVPDPLWHRLARDGLALLRRARFGRWGLPPDWLALPRLGGRAVPAPGWPPRFSYDAIRVPLYLAWAGMAQEPAAAAAARFWADPGHGRLPAWTDLTTDAVSPYAASGGVVAIERLLAWTPRQAAPSLPGIVAASDYYAAVLILLAQLSQRERMQHSV